MLLKSYHTSDIEYIEIMILNVHLWYIVSEPYVVLSVEQVLQYHSSSGAVAIPTQILM